MGKAAVWALAAGLAAWATPGWADTLIDNVRGVSFDTQGHMERFTGIVIGNDGHVAQVLRAYDLPATKVQYAVDAKGAALIPGLVVGHMHLMASALAAITPPEATGHPLPPPRPEDRDLALATIQPRLLARGITAVADMGTTIEDWQTYRRAGDVGRLAIRIVGYAAGTGNMVLIGDAQRSAHPSIGSGTRLAMEDSIVLWRALCEDASVPDAFARYERERRPVRDKLNRAAELSIAWYEDMAAKMQLSPYDLAYDYMLRTGIMTPARLEHDCPAFMKNYRHHAGSLGQPAN